MWEYYEQFYANKLDNANTVKEKLMSVIHKLIQKNRKGGEYLSTHSMRPVLPKEISVNNVTKQCSV